MSPLAVALAALLAGLMGYAIQRGATCTVAAVDQLLNQRRVDRLLAMAEAALWVSGGLLLAQALHRLPAMPAAYAVTGWTVLGGALLGLGAWVNKACVFGAIARFGNGEWAYIATPLGFYAGCLTVPWWAAAMPQRLTEPSPLWAAAGWLVWLFVGFVLWRIGRGMHRLMRRQPHGLARRLGATVWHPHVATTVIGIAFVGLLLLAGMWAYTDVLAALARGMADTRLPALLLLGLLAGAVLGGWTAGKLRAVRPRLAQWLRCAAGGLLMAWGSLLIPGSNDGLILIGLPLLRPYAWLGFATMCATIAMALLIERRRAV
jgi:toxin CptA